MKVPLKMDVFDDGDVQYLKFWSGGTSTVTKAPILPYCYSKVEPPSNARVSTVKRELLYDKDYDGPIYKAEFRTNRSMRESVGGELYMENGIQFNNRIYTDCPELMQEYAHKGPLKVLAFDIETDSYLTFPVAHQNAIIAIGLQLITYHPDGRVETAPIEIKMAERYDDDYVLLNWFINKIKEYDPDVYTHFNGTFFDWPYFFGRCDKHKIDKGVFSRDHSQPYIRTFTVADKIKQMISFGGRINYDIYDRSVMRDQNLFKKAPKDRRMKTVARLYNLDNVIEEPDEVMSNMRSIVNSQQLYDYLESDIRCTTFLCGIYLPAIIGMAERLNFPLDDCISGSPSQVGELLFGAYYHSVGIISDMNVGQAHPWESGNKQGAVVGCFKPGLYLEGIRKFDVQSYYPNLIRTLNLSPETTRIVRFEDGTRPYKATMSADNFLTLEIPDDKMNKQVIIEIDFNRRGFASSFVDTSMQERLELKKAMKTMDKNSPEWANADVNQLNLKVIMNSVTGYFGMGFANYGSLACYIAITGTGRYLIKKLIEHMGSTIALDTDGIVINSNEDIDETNKWLEQYIYEHLHVPKNYIHLEEEVFEAAYFNEGKKQYLLLERDEKTGEPELVIHGISFKGSNLPKLYSKVIDNIGLKMLLGEKDLIGEIDKYYNRANWTLGDLKKNLNVKPAASYAKGSPIGKQLALQYEERFKDPIKTETKLSYVKTQVKYGGSHRLVTIFDKIDSIPTIDWGYYETIVDSALERLGLVNYIPRNRQLLNTKQANLFDF